MGSGEEKRLRDRELHRRLHSVLAKAMLAHAESTNVKAAEDEPTTTVDVRSTGSVDRSVPQAFVAPGDVEIEQGDAQTYSSVLRDPSALVQPSVDREPRDETNVSEDPVGEAVFTTVAEPSAIDAEGPSPIDVPRVSVVSEIAPSVPPESPRSAPTLRLADPTIDRVWIPRDARPTVSMLRDVFVEHPEWIGVIGYDEFRREICKRRPTPWDDFGGLAWTEDDTSEARCWISDRLRAHVPGDLIRTALSVVARRARYNSLTDEIRSYRWDGVPRLDTWPVRYLRVEDTPYHRDVAARWLLSAVARAIVPGCKADHVLVLEGPRGGELKSSAIETLTGCSPIGEPYYCNSPIDLDSSFAPGQLIGVWIYELSEMTMFQSFGNAKSKDFLSRRNDDYSRKHEKGKVHQPRTCVMAATTNKERYLDDPSGSRRTWPVRVTKKIALASLARDREQLFAECVEVLLPFLVKPSNEESWRSPYFDEPGLIAADRQWWLAEAGEERAREEQELRYAADVWEEPISQWMDRNQRLLESRGYTTVSEILDQALKLKPEKWTRRDEMRVAEILGTRFRWRKGRRRTGPSGGLVYPYYLPLQPGEENDVEPNDGVPATPVVAIAEIETVDVAAEAEVEPTVVEPVVTEPVVTEPVVTAETESIVADVVDESTE